MAREKSTEKSGDHDACNARVVELEAALEASRAESERVSEDLRVAKRKLDDARAEIALMLEAGASKVEPVRRRFVRVRSRAERVAGLVLYGHQVTRAGFDLDVTDFTDRDMDCLLGDPNLEVVGTEAIG